jgi:murein DD-endopeptidase MepM/ murein hydrolase activator NlpD
MLLFGGLATIETCDHLANGSASQLSPELKGVKVTTQRDGELTRFYVENNELCEITMTFEMRLVNLSGSAQFPYTATFPAGATTEAFTLSPADSDARWEYSYTNFYKLGSTRAEHEDSYLYELPYAGGSAFRVTQAYGGTFSHKGSNKYAIDWKMPEGTPVHAARAGIVVKVKDDSVKGGSSMRFDRYNNYVLIRHNDGTLGHYCHLQKEGVAVKAGQRVEAGDRIAHSGNTGFSSGPHLHFCVFKTKNGRERESIPVKFRTAELRAITLVEGRTYKAADTASALVQSSKPELQSQGGALQ